MTFSHKLAANVLLKYLNYHPPGYPQNAYFKQKEDNEVLNCFQYLYESKLYHHRHISLFEHWSK